MKKELCLILFYMFMVAFPSKASAKNNNISERPELTPIDSLFGPAEGIFMMLTIPQSPETSEKTINILERNDCLDGVFIRVHWENIEKSNGDYDWSHLDWAVELAHKHGLQYKVMLQPGRNTPDWVYEEGAVPFETTFPWPMRSEYGQKTKIPVPWDPVYQFYFRKMLKKFGDRYGNDEHFVALTLTGVNFTYGEMHLPKTSEDMENWENFGDYPLRIENVYKDLIDFYAKVFPHQQMVLHLTMPIPGMGENVYNIVNYGLDKYPAKLALQNAQLTGHQNNKSTFSYQVITDFQNKAHVGFQSLNSFVAWKERVGSPEVAAYNFVKAGAEFWEIFVEDGADEDFTCRLSEMVAKAESMGAELYLEELEKSCEIRNVNDFAERRQVMEKLKEDGALEEALDILNETFRFTRSDISEKVKMLQQAGKAEDAVIFLKSVIERRNTAFFHNMLADVYWETGRIEEAAASFEKAYHRSQNSNYLIKKGKLYLKDNQRTETVETWRRILEAEGENQKAYKTLAELYHQFEFKWELEKLQAKASQKGFRNILEKK